MKLNSIFKTLKKANEVNKTINKLTKHLPDKQQKQVNQVKNDLIKKGTQKLVQNEIKKFFK